MLQMPMAKTALCLALLIATQMISSGCSLFFEERQLCDMTPDGSVWLTVVRLVWAEEKFHTEHHRYGSLAEMTNLLDGLTPEVTSGQMGSYTISINRTDKGFVLRANPDHPQSNRKLSSFYGDETGMITFDRSGKPAGPKSENMQGSPTHYSAEPGTPAR
jgi:hypothetical protein